MRNQKETIKELLEDKAMGVKFLFITDMLEDINWHTENKMLKDKFAFKFPNFYLDIEEARTTEKEESARQENISNQADYIRRDYKQVERYMAGINYMYGWGLDDSWDFNRGEEFVNELLEIIEKVGIIRR